MIPYIMVEPKQWSEMIQAMEENVRLKAENDRLCKAGDKVFREWSSGDEKDARNFMKALVIWNAAKEGKQP